MKKKQNRRKFIGKIKIKEPEFWVTEDEMGPDLAFVQKLHPERSIEEAFQELEADGYITSRINSEGKREFRFNKKVVDAAIAKLPEEVRNNPREIKIHEAFAVLCDYNNEMTTMLSVTEQQTNKLGEQKGVVPWIIKTQAQIDYDTMGLVKNVPQALAQLEAKNFIELTQNGPDQYRYRLNVPVVQAALDALPEKRDEQP